MKRKNGGLSAVGLFGGDLDHPLHGNPWYPTVVTSCYVRICFLDVFIIRDRGNPSFDKDPASPLPYVVVCRLYRYYGWFIN